MDLSSLNRATSTAVAYWSGMLICAAVLVVWWFERGPSHPVVALIATISTVALAVPALRRLPPRWCRVPESERVLHRILGVRLFGLLLEHSGWNRRNAFITWGSITRSRLAERALAARGGGGAHGVCFVVHALLAAVALFSGHPWGALWLFLPGLVLHLYPVLLQRSIMVRVQPLLDRSTVAKSRESDRASAPGPGGPA